MKVWYIPSNIQLLEVKRRIGPGVWSCRDIGEAGVSKSYEKHPRGEVISPESTNPDTRDCEDVEGGECEPRELLKTSPTSLHLSGWELV